MLDFIYPLQLLQEVKVSLMVSYRTYENLMVPIDKSI